VLFSHLKAISGGLSGHPNTQPIGSKIEITTICCGDKKYFEKSYSEVINLAELQKAPENR
jgi:hypothetical protein